MFKKILLLILLCITGFLPAQEAAGSIILYDGMKPFVIDSTGGWVEIRQIFQEDFNIIQPPMSGITRKWRMKISYIDETSSIGQSTLQIRLQMADSQEPLFTLPWTEQVSRWQEKNSNWYIPFNTDGMLGSGTLSVRLIAPPDSSAPGKIYKMELEAWDFPQEQYKPDSSTFHMASASTEDFLSPEINRILVKEKEIREEAMKFALDFIEYNISGDLPAFYKSLSPKIRILETGLSRNRYAVSPPATDLSIYTLDDYKNNYHYQIYGYNEYSPLFPSWFAKGRSWQPDRNCYLFLGTELNPGKNNFMNSDNLVFMLRHDKGSWEIIALPE